MITKRVRSFCLFILVLVVCSISNVNVSAQNGALYLDHTYGRVAQTDSIACGIPIEFHISTLNNSGAYILALHGVFEVNSPDGATWSPITMVNAPINWNYYLDGRPSISYYGLTGSGADTVFAYKWVILSNGIPDWFDSVTWIIHTEVDCSQEGKTICLDSVTNANGGTTDWVWGTPAGLVYPEWDGPHCLTISQCCIGNRGDLNFDGKSSNILDLSFAVDWVFRSHVDPGDCIESRDVNDDGRGPDILDLTYLVDYIFRGGPPPCGNPV